MERFYDWFSNLTTREQIILQVAAPVAVVICLLMLVSHTYQQMAAEKATNTRLLTSYEWLRTETRSISLWRAKFGKRSLGTMTSSDELGALLNNSMAKFGLKGSVNPDGDNWKVSVNPSDGNRVLSYIEAAVGAGAYPAQIKLTRADNRGRVNGHIVFGPMLDWSS